MQYPIVKIPTIICTLLEQQKLAKPSKKKVRSKLKEDDSYWLGLPLGIGSVVLIRYLFTLEWDFFSLLLFLLLVGSGGICIYFFLRYKDKPSETLVDTEKRIFALRESLKRRYSERPLKQRLKKTLRRRVKQLDPMPPDAQRGVSEDYFLALLQQYFGDTVQYPDGVFSIFGTTFDYTPDMVYRDPYTGLTIDIEIDEPYAGKSKEPHHCNDNDKDRNRDDFFLELNWVVVRFAEEQVVKYPVACAYYLSKVIYRLSGIRYEVPAEKLPPIATWGKEESTSMARLLHRETYLKEHGLWQDYR